MVVKDTGKANHDGIGEESVHTGKTLDDTKRLAEKVWKNQGGRFIGPTNAYLHSPELFRHLSSMNDYILSRTIIPGRLNELAICMAGRYYSADFEWYAHAIMAENAGLPKEILEELRGMSLHPSLGPPKSMKDAEELAVFKFVSELLHYRGKISDEAFEGIRKRWGTRGVMDLIGATMQYSIVSTVLNVDRVGIPVTAKPLPPIPLPPAPKL
ncbi:AhpD-like protein [Hyaloraphidium curvatum]|nr:AhpD-like protein [Hyaloraphidium curvatum]